MAKRQDWAPLQTPASHRFLEGGESERQLWGNGGTKSKMGPLALDFRTGKNVGSGIGRP